MGWRPADVRDCSLSDLIAAAKGMSGAPSAPSASEVQDLRHEFFGEGSDA